VNDLAAWREPWEVHHDQGYLIVDVTRAGYDRLLKAGFRLEIDERLTSRLLQPNVRLPGQTTGIPGYPCYRTVEETYFSAQALAATYPDLATWTDIGDSWEKTDNPANGYELMVLQLTNSAISGPKPKLFIMSSVHAREYTPAELATRFAEFLLEGYDLDPDVTWLLDYHEIHLMLQTNPDGRKRAETGLLWRKNTNNNYCPSTNLRGVDLNRNFEFQWGCCGGSSGIQCAETYRGSSAASEPETQATQDYVRAQFPDQRRNDLRAAAPITTTGVFLDIHSYSELVLWPWGFTSAPAPNSTALQTLGRKLAFFNGYRPEQAIALYPTDGTTDDFAYGGLGLAAYTFELGPRFFQDCATFENVILPDNLPALFYAAKVARAPYLTPSGPDALDLDVSPTSVITGEDTRLTATINDARYSDSNGVEPTQNITAAEYFIDIPPWVKTTTPVAVPMTAVDGNFDAPSEAVEANIGTAGLRAGRHTLFVRGQDAAGNWGAFSAAFLHVTEAITPTVEFNSNSPVVLGNTMVFSNMTTGALPLDYLWDFGDSLGFSTESDPVYAYQSTGTFTVTLTASNSLASAWVGHPVTVLTPTSGVTLTPATAVATGSFGQSATHAVTVTNLGNTFDRYRLDVSGNAWTTTLSITTTGELPSLGATSVQVTVDVPLSASKEQTDTVTLTATSQRDGTQVASSTLTTTARWFRFYLQLLFKGF
jgi:murein tripeptide amidase MpaA/PKD repeat protein